VSAEGAPPVRIEAWPDGAAWRRTRLDEDERFNEEYRGRLAAIAAAASGGWPAACSTCGRTARLCAPRGAQGDGEAHREHLACPGCGLVGRARAAFAVVDAERLPPASSAWITEHGTAAWRQLRRRVPATFGSEFHPSRRAPLRRLWHALRFGPAPHGDVLEAGFAAAALDLVLCLDVLEHVDDVDRALSELARVLRPGGALVATVPFDETAAEDRRLARRDGRGTLQWLAAEEWHADPLGARVPCFHRFGWALLGRVRAAGFTDADWCRVHAPAAGLFGLWVLRARR
jgi:SAM-dependent methyltransferase